MHLKQDELYDALGVAMEKIEMAGASPELTAAVVIVGDIRASIGNRWNPAQPASANDVRTAVKCDPLINERDDAEDAADKMASLVLGEPIDWPNHRAKWEEAIERLEEASNSQG